MPSDCVEIAHGKNVAVGLICISNRIDHSTPRYYKSSTKYQKLCNPLVTYFTITCPFSYFMHKFKAKTNCQYSSKHRPFNPFWGYYIHLMLQLMIEYLDQKILGQLLHN